MVDTMEITAVERGRIVFELQRLNQVVESSQGVFGVARRDSQFY